MRFSVAWRARACLFAGRRLPPGPISGWDLSRGRFRCSSAGVRLALSGGAGLLVRGAAVASAPDFGYRFFRYPRAGGGGTVPPGVGGFVVPVREFGGFAVGLCRLVRGGGAVGLMGRRGFVCSRMAVVSAREFGQWVRVCPLLRWVGGGLFCPSGWVLVASGSGREFGGLGCTVAVVGETGPGVGGAGREKGDWARGLAGSVRFGEGSGMSDGVTASVSASRGLGG